MHPPANIARRVYDYSILKSYDKQRYEQRKQYRKPKRRICHYRIRVGRAYGHNYRLLKQMLSTVVTLNKNNL